MCSHSTLIRPSFITTSHNVSLRNVHVAPTNVCAKCLVERFPFPIQQLAVGFRQCMTAPHRRVRPNLCEDPHPGGGGPRSARAAGRARQAGGGDGGVRHRGAAGGAGAHLHARPVIHCRTPTANHNPLFHLHLRARPTSIFPDLPQKCHGQFCGTIYCTSCSVFMGIYLLDVWPHRHALRRAAQRDVGHGYRAGHAGPRRARLAIHCRTHWTPPPVQPYIVALRHSNTNRHSQAPACSYIVALRDKFET